MGLVGILRPLTVYPAEMVYWSNLPQVTVFQGTLHPAPHSSHPNTFSPIALALHFNRHESTKRVRVFWWGFTIMFIYELFPAYIFPLLNSVSIFCLASQKAKPSARDVFTNIFGGGNANEGLGLLNFSFDWQYIGSNYMSYPLLQQGENSM